MYLQSGNIALRAVEPSDSDLLYEWENNIDLWKVSNRLSPISKFEIEQFILSSHEIQHQSQIRLMVMLTEHSSAETIGSVDVYDIDFLHLRAGIGIFISEKYRLKNNAKAAIRLAEQYCFETLGLYQLYALVGSKNKPSLKLFNALAYRNTDCRTDWLKDDDGYENLHCFQKNVKEYQKIKNNEHIP